MDFQNQTPYPASLFRSMHPTDPRERMIASLVCRITFDLAGTELLPAAEQPWKVSPGPWDGPKGPMAGDELFYRGGTDLFVFGSAHAPGGKPAPRVDVTIDAGPKFKHTLAVFGDRVWERKNGKFVSSAPKPFKSIPLTMANAFGGADVYDELPQPYGMNPAGKGYCMMEESVEGKSLPNIEHAERLIREWSETPEPYGTGVPPPNFAPKILRFVEFDLEAGIIQKIDPKFYNAAFPDMISPLVHPGDRIRITGVRPNGPVQFTIPPPPLMARVRIADRKTEALMQVDQIGIDVDALQVFIAYRYPFRYRVVPLEKRECELLTV